MKFKFELLAMILIPVIIAFSGCSDDGENNSDTGGGGGDASVAGITLNKSNTSTLVGGTEQLYAIVWPVNATNKNINWESKNTDIVTITLTGLVSAVSRGSAIVVATTEDGGHTASCTVTVAPTETQATGINLNKTSTTIDIGSSEHLNATINPSNATNQNMTWESDNESVAIVTSGGLVGALSEGTARITVKSEDGNYTATCTVTVIQGEIPVAGVVINKTSTYMVVSGKEQLSATIWPSNATNQNIRWESDDESVATISEDGIVEAVWGGTTTIKATTEDGNYEATCSITVSFLDTYVTGVSLDKTSTSIEAGFTEQLTATIAPSDATNQNMTWESDNESVAIVSSGGMVGALSEGTATITVTTEDGDYSATCLVEVSSVEVPVTGISLNKTSTTIDISYTEQLTATIIPSDATSQNVYWVSGDETIATVSSNGLVTAVSEGRTTIIAISENNRYSARCTVTTSPIPATHVYTTSLTSISVGSTTQLNAHVYPTNATNKNVTWSSSDETIATVSEDGVLIGIMPGNVTITVTTEDGGHTYTCYVTINEAGILDTNFNSIGYVVHHNAAGGESHDGVYGTSAVAIDENNKILVTGYSRNSLDNNDMVIWRYNSDGTLDTSFNEQGYVTHHGAAGGESYDCGYSIVINGDGKILVAGSSYNDSGDIDMAIWRYNSDGTLDTSFNERGYVTHHNAAGGASRDCGLSIAIDGNGKILVTGYSYNASGNSNMVIWRYNSNGTLDRNFNSQGYLVYNNEESSCFGLSLTIDENDRLLVTGYIKDESDEDMILWCYNNNGTLDTTFNSVGYVVPNGADNEDGYDSGRSITIDENGRILVAGYGSNGFNRAMIIWCYNSDGTLDTTFNSQGYVFHNSGSELNVHNYGHSIVIDEYGKILVTGMRVHAGGQVTEMVIWRCNSNGTLDETFNSLGYAVNSDFNYSIGYSIAISRYDKIIVVGKGYNLYSNYNMIIWNYNSE